MRAAIEASLMGPGPGGAFAAEEGAAASSDDDLARAPRRAWRPRGSGAARPPRRCRRYRGADEDADLAAAISASAAESFTQNASALCFRIAADARSAAEGRSVRMRTIKAMVRMPLSISSPNP